MSLTAENGYMHEVAILHKVIVISDFIEMPAAHYRDLRGWCYEVWQLYLMKVAALLLFGLLQLCLTQTVKVLGSPLTDHQNILRYYSQWFQHPLLVRTAQFL